MKKTKGIVTDYPNICIFCGGYAEEEHHLLFGHGLRPLADTAGIKVVTCRKCHTGATKVQERLHDNSIAEKLSKIAGQLAWEKHDVAQGHTEEESRTRYRNRYGVSYL